MNSLSMKSIYYNIQSKIILYQLKTSTIVVSVVIDKKCWGMLFKLIVKSSFWQTYNHTQLRIMSYNSMV